MSEAADPQVRQSLFSTITSDIGLPQLDTCDRVTLTRLIDGGLTTAILLESPEPISFVHDVTLTLTHHIRRFIPPPVRPPEPNQLAEALLPPARMPAPPIVRPPVGPPCHRRPSQERGSQWTSRSPPPSSPPATSRPR